MKKGIPDIGQDVPDFEVATSDGKTFKLSQELKPGQNVKPMFYRGPGSLVTVLHSPVGESTKKLFIPIPSLIVSGLGVFLLFSLLL